MYHTKKIDEVLSELKTSTQGLSENEALKRLRLHGENKLPDQKKTSLFVRFLMQFKDVMTIILLIAAITSLVIAATSKSNDITELIDGFIILGIVFLNTILGLVQELKAENALEHLKKMSQPYAKVMRGGVQTEVKTVDLVPGDIVIIEAGDVIPADLYLIESASLQCDEASLTGESHPSIKEAGKALQAKTSLGDRVNICYSSSAVQYGRGVGVVVATGKDAEIGKIAALLTENKKEDTPLEKSLQKLGGVITIIVLTIAIIIFVVNIITKPGETLNSFLTAVAIAVAAIPESLPAVVTVILSIGVVKLAKKKVIIKRLHAVETLGCCEVICSDKTGTITQNKMTVREVYYNSKLSGSVNTADPVAAQLLRCMTLCNDAKQQGKSLLGDPTETALLEFAKKYDYHKSGVDSKFVRVGEIPFDSNRKMMSTANLCDGKIITYTKGAVDKLLDICDYILIDGKKRKITQNDKADIHQINTELGLKALRVLGFATGEYSGKVFKDKIKEGQISEKGLTFVGLAAMMDPPRSEVADALKTCKSAGLRAIMITGDHKDTAYAIAHELGMVANKKQVVEGIFLDKFTDEQLKAEINKYNVFSRVSPEHKVRIVKALRANGKVVAMTGDGVNDAPSIKSANIGIGMGITGTEVTKEVADMVLSDDNFATIIVGIEEGRKIFANIQKTIQFLLGCNVAEVLTIFILTLLYPTFTILWPVQILFINLISDTLPAIALGMEDSERDVMTNPPRKQNASIIGGMVGKNIIFQGVAQTLLVISAFLIGFYGFGNEIIGATMSFLVLNMIQLFHMFNCRTNGTTFKGNPFKNKMLVAAFVLGIGLTLIIALVPFMEVLFNIVPLNALQWVITISLAVAIIPICEIGKILFKLKKPKPDHKDGSYS